MIIILKEKMIASCPNKQEAWSPSSMCVSKRSLGGRVGRDPKMANLLSHSLFIKSIHTSNKRMSLIKYELSLYKI